MKHVIMVSIDNLRFDCIGYHPYKKELKKYHLECLLNTPNLDSIAEKGVYFINAISTSTYTTTSHASIVTGLFPPRHGIRGFFDRLSDKAITLAELFRNQGYLTILSTDTITHWKPNNLSRGFTYIFEKQDEELYKFLDLHKSENIFLLIHYFDIHDPYLFSEYEIHENYNADYYDMIYKINKIYEESNITIEEKDKIKKDKIKKDKIKKDPWSYWKQLSIDLKKDRKIFFPIFVKGVNKFDKGRFNELIKYLKKSNYLDDSLLVIFSDHGEGRFMEEDNTNKDIFGGALRLYHDHMSFGHAGRLYDDVIRVPLIIYHKNIKPRIIDAQISTVDIFPTIIDLSLDYDIHKIDGQSLAKKINGTNKDDHLAYSEVSTPYPQRWELSNSYWTLHQRSIRHKGKKYIIFGKPEVFTESPIMALMLFSFHYIYKFINNSIFESPNEKFIKKIYNYILGRNVDDKDLKFHLKDLDNNIVSKKDFLLHILKTEEYRKRGFIIFDLKKDPDEKSPINPIKNPFYIKRFFDMLRQIFIIEKSANNSTKEEQINVSEDEKKFKERLEKLGYLD